MKIVVEDANGEELFTRGGTLADTPAAAEAVCDELVLLLIEAKAPAIFTVKVEE